MSDFCLTLVSSCKPLSLAGPLKHFCLSVHDAPASEREVKKFVFFAQTGFCVSSGKHFFTFYNLQLFKANVFIFAGLTCYIDIVIMFAMS